MKSYMELPHMAISHQQRERSIDFMKCRYRAARMFFLVIKNLKLAGRGEHAWLAPFGTFYYADKLTQRISFGTYDPRTPGKGAQYPSQGSVYNCPPWFS